MYLLILVGILFFIGLVVFILQTRENINSLDDSIRIGAGYIAGPDYSYHDENENCSVCN